MGHPIGPFFRTADKYTSLYKRIERLPKTEGFKDFCWFGGRVMVWIPYKKIAGTTTYNHITDSSELVWDTTTYVVDLPSTEVEADDVCLRWYTGPLTSKVVHALPRDCYEKTPLDWSPCVTCSVPHTFGKLSKIALEFPEKVSILAHPGERVFCNENNYSNFSFHLWQLHA